MMGNRIVWNVEVTEHLDYLLEDYIRLDSYKTKSEFIRGAVREKLQEETAILPRRKRDERSSR